MSDITIRITERPLSDGSLVYDVWCGAIVLPAVTEADAWALADKLQAAITDHSVYTVRRRGCFKEAV